MAASRRDGGSNDGWNDPPMFNYNAVSPQGPSAQRHRLNKRVSYPIPQGNSSSTQSASLEKHADTNLSGALLSPKDVLPKLPPVHILPPTSSTSVHPPVPLLVPNMSPPVDPSSLPPSFASAGCDPQMSETLPQLLERLNLDSKDSLRKYTKKVLHETVDSLKENIQGRSREDVQTRLGLLDDQWREEKISEDARVKLGCLASAIKNNDLKQADRLHLALMVDHISEVSQWMVGVKRIINELKLSAANALLEQNSLKKSTSSEGDAPSEAAVKEDHCVDTVAFSDLPPVLMPESLGPGAAQKEQEDKEENSNLEKSEDKQKDNENASDNR